ncbi:MAG: hypothetical protein V7L31_20990 [Nostoc sp.]|uniref:hypothetical protein n=1 Tax=Nostoc sp. TaxID=1180 RepID=UPI002FEF5354
MSAPVTLYSPDGGRAREIAAIDAPGWIQAGWSKSPVLATATPVVVALESEPAPEPQPQAKSKRNDVSRDGVPEN